MGYTYSSIKLEGKGFGNYVDASSRTKIDSIDGLSRVNIFVGSNNSGKSRFLRELLKMENYLFHSKEARTEKFLRCVKEVSEGIKNIKDSDGSNIVSFSIQGFRTFNDSDFSVIEFNYFDFSGNFQKLKDLLIAFRKGQFLIQVTSHRGSNSHYNFTNSIQSFFNSNAEKIDFIINFSIEKASFKKVYIPILRSLNNFDTVIDGSPVKDRSGVRDFFRSRTQQIYEFSDLINIFTGQSLYFDVRDMLLGDHEKRQRIADYEKFLSEELFEKRSVSLIPMVDSDVLHIKIGNEEKAIYNLGDGIQNLIILTFQLFMIDEGLFFIEEPEINLHPGMQRKFLEVILNNKGSLAKKNHQYFFTTHSNHFLDLTLDYKNISIYKFSSDGSSSELLKYIEQVSSGDERVLQELGVRNSSVFLTNATIWVEGITDRLYIKRFLELYQDNFEDKIKVFEDIDYSFVEYGGNNITHWSFLDTQNPPICIERLCGKALLIVDHDGENKIDRHVELEEKLGTDRFVKLECREIENILSLETIGKSIRKYPAESDFVMPTFKIEYPHKDKPIGAFIQTKLKPKNDYKGKSGTLKSTKKLDFCIKATEDLKFSEMTDLAKSLSEKIYNFIVSQKT